ncbi:MAG TPA: hypothetical protein VKJ47_24285 [Candidatus Binatia bacterium]|nr:hypothetical protein [Candidatus Binatia bacterium]
MTSIRRLISLAGLVACALLAGGAPRISAQGNPPDPAMPGPFAVTRAEYNFGDTAFTPPGFPGPVEVRASVHFPTGLSGGPFPLLVFLHGRHATCFVGGAAFLQWPCPPPRASIPSFRGYDYLAEIFASRGYIVLSISANGINARDNQVFDLGMLARAQLIQHHLELWQTLNSTGGAPFGTQFVGKVNLANIGTMGHSRGGEGVVRHFLFNASLGSPFGIRAVLPLAPVDFSRPVINNVPLEVVLPYCDGDVSNLQGVHFFDDARYNVAGDAKPKHTVLVMGANHNFFNTIWTPELFPAGTADDWLRFVTAGSEDQQCGRRPQSQRLSPEEQRGTLLAYATAFFRNYIGGETQFFPFLQGDAPPPPSAMTNQIHVSYHPAATERRDVNRLLNDTNLTTNTLGGAVAENGITPYDLCGGEVPEPRFCLPGQPNSRQPHTSPSARARTKRGLSQLRAGWSATTASYQNDLPAGQRDVSLFAAVQFRASVNFSDPRNSIGVPQNLSVTLTDGMGNSSTARVSDFSTALFFPPGGKFGAAVIVPPFPVPKVLLNTVRVPLAAFSGVNLTDIRSVKFRFDQSASGALLVSDLAFAN